MIEKTTWAQLQPLYRYVRQQAENKKFMKYLEVGATFTLIAIFLLFAIRPTASAISQLLGEIKSKELIIKQSKNKINSILAAQTAYSEAQGKYYVIKSSLPDNPGFYQTAVNFYSLADLSSVNVKDLSFILQNDSSGNKSNKNSKIESRTFSVQLNGTASYSQSLDLIKKILENRRLVDLTNIQISQIKSKSSNSEEVIPSNLVSFSLSNNLFYSNSNGEKK